jgi:hypothetical protein
MGVELTGGDWLDRNRANWDERVPVHVAAPMYDRARLREGGSLLDPIAAAGIARLFPDGLDGVRVLHLQCHFGSDTLSLVNAGATAVGLDFSRPAVEEARRMAEELGVADRARFVEANVFDARLRLPEPSRSTSSSPRGARSGGFRMSRSGPASSPGSSSPAGGSTSPTGIRPRTCSTATADRTGSRCSRTRTPRTT